MNKYHILLDEASQNDEFFYQDIQQPLSSIPPTENMDGGERVLENNYSVKISRIVEEKELKEQK